MMTRFIGGCMSGPSVTNARPNPIAMGNRHCRDCQLATGSAFAAAILVPNEYG